MLDFLQVDFPTTKLWLLLAVLSHRVYISLISQSTTQSIFAKPKIIFIVCFLKNPNYKGVCNDS